MENDLFKGLSRGDTIELIAPASRCALDRVEKIKHLLEEWGFRCWISPHLFGDDLLCAHSAAQRFQNLKDALLRPETKAILCVRGGYGSMHLIPDLLTMDRPPYKIVIGMSDITALHLFLNQKWHWPVLHASLGGVEMQSSRALLKAYLGGEQKHFEYTVEPYNAIAEGLADIQTCVTGGNLSILQASIGTSWQVNARHQYLFIEEINERAYRVDRMLTHLEQAGRFEGICGIIFGDFLGGEEPDGSQLIDKVLLEFAQKCSFPVSRLYGVGHGPHNDPLPLGVPITLRYSK